MQIPIFPLNTVLLPKMVISLQIFEPRYLAMLRDLQKKGESRFSVHLIRKGREVGGPPPQPYAIGCLAQILDIQTSTEEGFRLFVQAIGLQRVRIHHMSLTPDGYYSAEVQEIPYFPYRKAEKNKLEKELMAKIREILSRPSASNLQPDLELLAQEELALVYAVPGILANSNMLKLKFLKESDVPTLYRMAISRLADEIRLLRQHDSIRQARNMGPFSIN
ncbi:MAG: LON peptidase substrate-binding domain-containing protein [Leptospiraceae bacterium]|nr:LON peptidase substrate-binding domain-containing protein [Leptospiraceae bacterium]MDW8306872.1 LON peptidase substrate-binding domain-containing protein [Leptospiraceae bacterium]